MPQKKGIERFIRPDLASFGGYSTHTSPETLEGKVAVPLEDIIKLDANENPWGCSPRVAEALADYKLYNIYPDDGQIRLRKMLQDYCGVNTRHIVAGAGSNQLIDLLLRIFLNPGDEVINSVPTFGIYKFSTDLCGGKIIEVPRDKDFNLDVSGIKKAVTDRTKVIFLVNPNSPTGTLTPEEDILEVLDTGLPVVVDEAYYEFSRQTVASLVGKYENLIVLRTFSKWAGLAGLRVGYGLFPEAIADFIQKTKIPYNVNVAALVAVEESLKDIDRLNETVRAIVSERERLLRELEDIDYLRTYPTHGNFILCKVLKGEARELRQRLEQQGILVRYFDQPLLDNYIRISVGKPEHTDALIAALRGM